MSSQETIPPISIRGQILAKGEFFSGITIMTCKTWQSHNTENIHNHIVILMFLLWWQTRGESEELSAFKIIQFLHFLKLYKLDRIHEQRSKG